KPKKPEQISNQDLVSLLGQITSLEGHIDSQTAEVTALRQRVFLLEQAKAQENQENGNQGMFQSQGLSNTPEVSDTQIRLSRQLSSASEISNTQFRTPGNSSFKVILATILGT
ncbi:MAG TPA: hypothetical protein VHA52_11710, partial [Candidatus Babeliaceae bacterium]|nr:hypothetical protein [Candidatus Babeliaceae bacterium]